MNAVKNVARNADIWKMENMEKHKNIIFQIE